ncbi:MAG: hypothetical protein ACRD5G_16275 [Candidatus Acidiferrales bacterium]
MPRRRRELRVLLVGAGVSASCGIAVAKDILRESLLKLTATEAGKAHEVHNLLRYLYPDFDASYRNYPNIEDFLNLLEMAKAFNSQEFIESSLWSTQRLEETNEIILRAVTEYVWEVMNRNQKPRHITEFFTNHVPIGNVVITFNWDLTVEEALRQRRDVPQIVYSYKKKESHKQITLLKPHGSIDWFNKQDIRAIGIERPIRLHKDVYTYEPLTFLISRDLFNATPLIIPPVASKQFSNHGIFRRTWISVYRAVSDATTLTVLGYSLPKEDQFSRFVLRRALRNNIRRAEQGKKQPLKLIVVNPDETTETTFARIAGRENVRFHFHRAYFQDFVDSLQ